MFPIGHLEKPELRDIAQKVGLINWKKKDIKIVLQISKVVNLPEHVLPLNVIALGYPDEEKDEVNRFDPKKVHLETW